MRAYDSAEVCELLAMFIIYQLSRIYSKNDIGLYRDDGWAVFRNTSGPQAQKIKKHFQSKSIRQFSKSKNIKSKAFREYSHRQGYVTSKKFI